jgi:hypothetical protein
MSPRPLGASLSISPDEITGATPQAAHILHTSRLSAFDELQRSLSPLQH